MASVYTNDLRLEEIGSGEQSGSWGDTTNTNLELIAEAFAFGTEAITTNADTHATTIADGATDPGRAMFLKYTGTLDSACTITLGPNTVSKLWFIENGTSGSQNIIIKQGSGATVTIPPGDTKAIYSNGAGSGGAMVDAFASLSVVDLKVQDDLTVTDDLVVGGDIDLEGSIDVNGTANLDIVDIDGAVNMATTALVTGVLTTTAATVFNGGFAANDGSTITTADATDTLSLISTDAGTSVAPNLSMYRNSGSPAANDQLGQIQFTGKNASAEDVDYAVIGSQIIDATDGSEDGRTFINSMVAGTIHSRIDMQATETVINNESLDLDFRVESNNTAHLLFADGGEDVVGIGTPTPVPSAANYKRAALHIHQEQGGASGSQIHMTNDATGAAAGKGMFIAMWQDDDVYFTNQESDGNIKFSTGGNANVLVLNANGSLSTSTAGSNNTRFGLNAGDAIASGGNFNVCVGDDAGTAITTGDSNTALGYNALASEDEGNQNTAVGVNALANLNSGTNYNVAVGSGAGFFTTTGAANTFLGGIAGQFVSTGSSSTFVGYSAGLGITGAKLTGGDNTAVGRDAGLLLQGAANGNSLFGRNSGDAITTGNRITAIGYGALSGETTGTRATAVGYQALAIQNKAAESHNTAVGYKAGASVTSGDHNTIMGYGAFDDCDDGNFNVAIGSGALSAQATDNNVAIGYNAGNVCTAASNVFVGTEAGLSSTGSGECVVIGSGAGQFMVTANDSVFIGHSAGKGITGAKLTGSNNVAIGNNSGLLLQGAAHDNTFVGKSSGDAITTGADNVAVGKDALGAGTDSQFCTAVGMIALGNADAGTSNTCIGYAAGANTTGGENTCLGVNAGDSLGAGSDNIIIGVNADASASNGIRQIIMGTSVTGVGNNNFTFGYSGTDSNIAFGATTITAPSDQRYKEDIADATAGLAFIKDLRPVTFKWRKEKDVPSNHASYVEGSDTRVMNDYTNHGFIAQEVKTAIDAHSDIKDGFDMWSEENSEDEGGNAIANGRQRLGPSSLIPILVKAIQELEARLAVLEG